MRDDRPGRADRKLLARDLEDERAEGIERRKLVHPGPRAEIRPRLDQPRKHGVRVSQVLARLGIGGRSELAGWGVHAHAFSSRSVSTISTTSATVSSRAQSRWSSHASATQLIGCAPAWTTRSRPARWASSLVPPMASTTG